jgi:hypothetical protein
MYNRSGIWANIKIEFQSVFAINLSFLGKIEVYGPLYFEPKFEKY